MIAVLKNLPRPVVVFIIIAATFLVYAPALRNGFVWDDTALVLRDPLVRSWVLIPEGFRHFLFLDATASKFYRPMQRLTFVADYQLYAFSKPWGWHLTSIGVHAAAAVALFFLALKIMDTAQGAADWGKTPNDRWALAAGLVWAIHPLHTSAVTYVSGRADPLAALFEFSGLALGLASLEGAGRASWTRAIGAAACFLAAMLSKESGLVVLLIWFLMLAWRRAPWRVIGQWMAIAACITGIYCALRLTAENTPPPASSGTPAVARPILAARAWAGYAALLVAPVNLHMERDVGTHPGKDASATLHSARMLEYQTLAGVLLFGGFCFWWWRSWRNAPGAALCLSAFIIAYLPISDLLPLNATMAEHWLYVPSAFLFIAALITLRDWLPGAPAAGRVAVRFIGAAWYSFLVFRTADQQHFWRDQRAFITHTMAAGGDTARMRMNLGALESSEGRNDLALMRYREAVERSPDLPIVWLSYASVLLRARDFEGARHALEKAEASPMFAAECAQTRAVLEHLQTGADTGDMLRKAAEVAPRNWPVRQRYVEYLMERGSLEAALHELRGFIEAHPFRGESWKLLGTLLERMGKPDLALTAYEQAAELDVHDEESRNALRRLEAERNLRTEAPPRKSARAFGKEAGNPLDIA
jgi:Flp pilus assembly protein TadD